MLVNKTEALMSCAVECLFIFFNLRKTPKQTLRLFNQQMWRRLSDYGWSLSAESQG